MTTTEKRTNLTTYKTFLSDYYFDYLFKILRKEGVGYL